MTTYKLVAKVQSHIQFDRADLPMRDEGWHLKAAEGASQLALRIVSAKYQSSLMHLESLVDPPAVRCKRRFAPGELTIHVASPLRVGFAIVLQHRGGEGGRPGSVPPSPWTR